MAGRSAHSCSSPASRSRKVDRRTFANRDFWLKGTGNRFRTAVSTGFFALAPTRAFNWPLARATRTALRGVTRVASPRHSADVGTFRRDTSLVAPVNHAKAPHAPAARLPAAAPARSCSPARRERRGRPPAFAVQGRALHRATAAAFRDLSFVAEGRPGAFFVIARSTSGPDRVTFRGRPAEGGDALVHELHLAQSPAISAPARTRHVTLLALHLLGCSRCGPARLDAAGCLVHADR